MSFSRPVGEDRGSKDIKSLIENDSKYRNGTTNNTDQISCYLQYPVFYHDFTYDVIQTRVISAFSFNGSVSTVANGFLTIQNSTATNSRGIVISKRFFKYNITGSYEYTQASRWYPNTYDSNTRIDLGLISSGNGTAFAYLNGGFGVITRYDGVDTFTSQLDFNVDRLDGSGPSGFIIDVSTINVYKIQSQNIGNVSFFVYNSDPLSYPRYILCHTSNNVNRPGNIPFSRQPNMFICNEVSNQGSTLEPKIDLYSLAVNSNIDPEFTVNPSRSFYTFKNVGTTFEPLFSLTNKSSYLVQQNRQEVFLKSIAYSSDSNRLVRIQLILNGIIVGASFTDVDTNLSILEFSNTETSISGGSNIVDIPVGKADNAFIDLSSLKLILFPGETISVVASTLSGAGDVSASLIVIENL